MRRTALHGFACGRDSLPQSASLKAPLPEGAATTQIDLKNEPLPMNKHREGFVLRIPAESAEGVFAQQKLIPGA